MSEQPPQQPPPPPPKLPVEEQWLQDLLNKEYKANGTLAGVKVEIIGDGKGFLSFIFKATLEWSGDDTSRLPKTVILKKPTYEKIKQIPIMAELFSEEMVACVHNTEINVYTYFNLYPPQPIPMARCLYKERMTTAGTGLLVFEEVKGGSLTFNDDLSVAQMKVLAGHVASVQAYAFNHPDSVDYIGKMPFNGFELTIPQIPENAKKLRKMYPEVFKLTDEDVARGIEKLKELNSLMMDPEKIKEKYTPAVCLGDMQPNNVLWKFDSKGCLTNDVAALIDFQITHQGASFYDLSALMSMGMSLEDVRDHAEHIYAYFYKELEKKLGSKPPYSLDELIAGYKEFSGMFGTMMINFATQFADVKDMFGFSDQRIMQMVEKITYSFQLGGLL